VAGFVDAGNAADDRLTFRLLPGYGAGARWRSPAGPLAVDLAYGQEERKLRLHLSIAVAF
jgi:translocation and assembly module TamA